MSAVVYACATAVVVSVALSATARAQQVTRPPESEATANERTAGATVRDPFVRHIAVTSEAPDRPATVPRAEGFPGLSIEDIALRGVLQASGGSIAFVQAPDEKHHVIRAGDRLRDGHVHAITVEGLILIADEGGTVSQDTRRAIRLSIRAQGEDR
jgi:Tfp pilus assembly protein PilP